MSLYIVLLEEMKLELKIPDSQDDDLLTQHMEGLQGRFDDHLNRTLLWAEGEEEVLDGGVRALKLRRYPVDSVTSIHVSGAGTWDDTTLTEAASRVVDWEQGLVRLRSGNAWSEGRGNVRVVYNGGYVATGTTPSIDQENVPEAIRRAFRMQMAFEYRNRKTLGLGQISGGGASLQMGSGVALALKGMTLLPEVEQTLAKYKAVI